MNKIFDIIFLIGSFFIIAFGLLCLSALFLVNGLTTTQIVGTVFIGGFFVLVGIGGISASLYFLKL